MSAYPSPQQGVDIAAHVFIVAVEPSGDELGSALSTSLRQRDEALTISAIGGPSLHRAGHPSQMSIEGLAILGFVEGLKAYGFVLRKVKECVEIILASDPDAVVLIDSWGFMVRVAKGLKARGYRGKIVKFVAPQVWAMRSGRARILARYVDYLLSTQPMDAPFFEAAGLPQTFVGNPVLDRNYDSGDAQEFRDRHGLDAEAPAVGLFFGSRPAEINRVGPAVLNSYAKLLNMHPTLQAICVIADPVRDTVLSMLDNAEPSITIVDQSQFLGAMAAMDVAIACSGTVTTQLAAAGVPVVVMYELSSLTYFFANRMFKPRYVSLVNISADGADEQLDAPLMPEFLQDEIHGDAPALAAARFINDPDFAAEMSQTLIQETRRMGAGSGMASDRAAEALLSLIA